MQAKGEGMNKWSNVNLDIKGNNGRVCYQDAAEGE